MLSYMSMTADCTLERTGLNPRAYRVCHLMKRGVSSETTCIFGVFYLVKYTIS